MNQASPRVLVGAGRGRGSVESPQAEKLKRGQRLDYNELNRTGKKVIISDNTTPHVNNPITNVDEVQRKDDHDGSQGINTSTEIINPSIAVMSKDGDANILEASLSEDIIDYLEENPIHYFTVVEDIDVHVTKLEVLRTKFRNIHKTLKSIDEDTYELKYGKSYQEIILNIKAYMLEAKKKRNIIRLSENEVVKEEKLNQQKKKEEEYSQMERSADFLITDVDRRIKELNVEFGCDVKELSNEELLRKKECLPSHIVNLDRLSSKFEQLLGMIPKDYLKMKVTEITHTYNKLVLTKGTYVKQMDKLIEEREIIKERHFQTSCLNIKLRKFEGYDSVYDIYSFKSEFEKLYLKSTPKMMLPDLLKNNYLDGPALALVQRLDDIDEIWKRLKKSYGDAKVMLQKKLAEVKRIGPLWKIRGTEELKEGLIAIVNAMSDLIKLSKEHKIENILYYGESINVIYGILGDVRLTKWLTSISDEEIDEKQRWPRLIQFLERDLKVQQEKSIINHSLGEKHYKESSVMDKDKLSKTTKHDAYLTSEGDFVEDGSCHFCGISADHVKTPGPKGTKLTQYFSCKKFAEMTPNQRFLELRFKGLCFQCLYPGAVRNQGSHKNGNCQLDFTCKHPSHNSFPTKKHVLVCQEHSESPENKALLEEYKSRCVNKHKATLHEYSTNIKLSFHSISSYAGNHELYEDEVTDDAGIYVLQTVKIADEFFTLFFDCGCSDFVSRYSAVKRIGSRANQEVKGPMYIGGVGSVSVKSQHGVYKVDLPLWNHKNAVLAGVCLDVITSSFPMYPLKDRVKRDIDSAYTSSGGDINDLPGLPEFVGGDIDFMIGVKYLRYFPEAIFSLPSGLTIYRSPFVNPDGSRGVVGGPHAVFTEINRLSNIGKLCQATYLSEQYQLYNTGYQINPDEYFLDIKCAKDFKHGLLSDVVHDEISQSLTSDQAGENKSSSCLVSVRNIKLFDEVENAGSEIHYRCIDCRNCQKCRHGDKIELISINEEVEQDIINKSVNVNLEKGNVMARLPLIDDPIKRLVPNKKKAMAVFNSQIRKLSKNQQDKEDVIKSEKKMQDLGFVDYVRNLSASQQLKLQQCAIQNFIPSRAVWNENSCTTPCRIVFDASQPTDSSFSLNSIVAKGRNNMNKLVEIMIRWVIYPIAFHTDVQKMYNSIVLLEEDWCLQRYIWQKDLDGAMIPEEKIIKTLIYGVKSSGNQAERGLRETAKKSKDMYPDVDKIIQKDVYVDDCISGAFSREEAFERADELMLVLKRGGFNLKGFTFTGMLPPKELSQNGNSINVAGCKWYSEEDELQLDISELNFAKRVRGKKISETKDVIPEFLTRRHCSGKVAEIFDLTGRVTPITASMKLDLQVLVRRKFDWDDTLPNDLREVWLSHFETMKELSTVRFKRAIIPHDAVSLDINTIDVGDSSKNISCAAIYARFKKQDGSHSCQLVFSRSKIVPEGLSQPRAELFAAMLNAHTGDVVKRSFHQYHKGVTKLTDSQVVLHWINNRELPLKQWVRSRVIEILRFNEASDWYYIQSSENIADLGTRRGAKVKDIVPGSIWSNGYSWMKRENCEFPTKSLQDIKFDASESETLTNEMLSEKQRNDSLIRFEWPQEVASQSTTYICSGLIGGSVPNQVTSRYAFSSYLLDPNKYRFHTVVRIIALVQRFVRNVRRRCEVRCTVLLHTESEAKLKKAKKEKEDMLCAEVIFTDEEIKHAENYYYLIATQEVKHFVKEKDYKQISVERNSILYYTGRILPTQEFNITTTMTDVMRDLTSTSFCVPIVDKYSPLAYSLISEIHWHHEVAKHSGVETVMRYVMQRAYVLEGRDMVKLFRKNCERCRYLAKRTIDVSMGPVSSYNLTIAPAFYITQLDLAGPFKAYSVHNKRTTIKIWLVVYCCTTTSTTNIKVMDDYSTNAFIKSFIRFSCEVGYPKVLLPDEGSQLIQGCEGMKLDFKDLKNKLHLKKNIEFETCPVGGHNMHGRVERKIKQIKESIMKSFQNERLSVIEWETLSAQISNTINDLPLALGNVVSELENADLITPNRLRLGRNNQRSPVGALEVTSRPDKFLKLNQKIYDVWFENWLISYVPKLMKQPKWFKNDKDLKEGDVVLFLKQEGSISGNYQYGMVSDVKKGKDGRIRTAAIRYRNNNEMKDRVTNRAVRELVMIHPIDELNIIQELGEVSSAADAKRMLEHKPKAPHE